MADFVAPIPSTVIKGYALALPNRALDPFGEVIGVSNTPPADSSFLVFGNEVEPTDYVIHEPFGKRRTTAPDGSPRYTTLPTVTLMWRAIGITRLASGTTPATPAPGSPETARTLQGIYRLVIRALTEREGKIWLIWQRQAFRTPIPDPSTFPSSQMWYKDICTVRQPKWLTSPEGVAMTEFRLEFCNFGLSGEDVLYKGGTPLVPPGAGTGNPATSGVRWAGGFGIGSFGKNGFGIGSMT